MSARFHLSVGAFLWKQFFLFLRLTDFFSTPNCYFYYRQHRAAIIIQSQSMHFQHLILFSTSSSGFAYVMNFWSRGMWWFVSTSILSSIDWKMLYVLCCRCGCDSDCVKSSCMWILARFQLCLMQIEHILHESKSKLEEEEEEVGTFEDWPFHSFMFVLCRDSVLTSSSHSLYFLNHI